MDNSQSSDFLSESTDIFCNSPTDPAIMDSVTYESLVLNTKSALSSIRNEKKSFSVQFSTLLDDCCSCVSQSLDLITGLLAETNLKQNKLKEYMNNAVSLLQLLSDLIKYVVETMYLACCSMKTFPTATGRIIMLVFIHCKDSESVYGSRLSYVEKQLKDLFRTCHELQLTYLMVLEKHFIFDLTEREELDILIEALDINLKIGEIVQTLDVKTMAEQWKAYTVICEKYSNYLMDKTIYSNSTKILCSMITNNMKTALEENQEEKVVLRSLKISNFTLKILLRVCNTFKHAVLKEYTCLVELLLYSHQYNEAYLHTMAGKSVQFINLVNNNVTSPVNLLLTELMMDEKLLACIYNYNINEIRRDNKLLGLIMLVISIIRISIQKSGDPSLKVLKHQLINTIYKILPYGHIWFNLGLVFKCDSSREFHTYGLYEHLLTHSLALVSTMNTEDINVLEKILIEGVLNADCLTAMFSSNLWTILARILNRQFLLSQVLSLNKIYQKLENNYLFTDSPQKVHLSHTIGKLFEAMHKEDKIKVYNMFPINEDNYGLWTCLKLCNLPNDIQLSGEEIAMENLKKQMKKLLSSDNVVNIDELVKLINLASTCSIFNREEEMESLLIQAWMKASPIFIPNIDKTIDKGNVWYYRYIEALVSLTNSMDHIFHNSINLVKVLHMISLIVQSGCKELKLLLISLLSKLANFETYDKNKHLVDTNLTQALTVLFQDTDLSVKNTLFTVLRKCRNNSLDRIVSKIVNEGESLRETWSCFIKHGRLRKDNVKLKEHLLSAIDFKYFHKCMQDCQDIKSSGSVTMQKSLSNNFDFVDIDSLFDADSDSEPASKKAKLNTNEVEQVLSRLETDAESLCKIKENIFTSEYLKRIKDVCSKLNNILD